MVCFIKKLRYKRLNLPKIAISAMHGVAILFSRGHVILSSLRHSQTSLAYRKMRARIFCFKYPILALYKRSEIVLIQINNKPSMWHYKSLHIVMFYHFCGSSKDVKSLKKRFVLGLYLRGQSDILMTNATVLCFSS